MKKILLVFGLCFCWTLMSNGQSLKNVDFKITWQIGSPNTYDSKTGEFQKDLVGEVFKGKMKLSRKEKKSILQKITEINFWNIPERYNGTRPKSVNGEYQTVSVQPNMSYTITVIQLDKTHTVRWTDESIDMGEKGSYNDLSSLFRLITSILDSHKKWKNSPPMRGGYM